MKKLLIFLVLGIFLLSLASAQIETKYYIYQNKVLVEHSFEKVLNLELKIPYDSKGLNVNLEYELGEDNIIKVSSGENLSIKYVSESMVDKAKKGNYFTAKNHLDVIQKVKLILPESAILVEEGIVFPEPDVLSSDGRSIILMWENYNESQIVVNYEFVKKQNSVWLFLILIIILLFIIYSIFQKKKFKKEIKKVKKKSVEKKPKKIKQEKIELATKNLFGDEKKIVEFLLSKKKNESWTKEILKGVEITKVKLSRKLRSLEQKELIKKIPYGNENKVRLLKR